MKSRKEIAKIISKRPPEKIKTIKVKCRPREKSNKVLVTRVLGHDWYCERPNYFWSEFDLDFVGKPYLDEPKILRPDISEPMALFDDKGLYWTRAEVTSFNLVKLFLTNPSLYINVMAMHEADIKIIVDKLQRVRKTIRNEKHLKHNLLEFTGLYNLFYRTQLTIYMTFDELALQFRQFLHKHLPKELANIYFTDFLQGEMTKKALELGYVEERGKIELQTIRGVLYGMDITPRVFYTLPKFFIESSHDQEVISRLIEKKLPSEEMKRFFAFRMIVPLGFQINEESQYFETSMLSAHLGVIAKKIAKKLSISIEELQTMSVKKIIRLI